MCLSAKGFFYLVAVMDWATRHVLSWRLYNTMDASFCTGALDNGLDVQRIIGSWIDFYNEVRPHSSLGGRTPGEAYRNGARAA